MNKVMIGSILQVQIGEVAAGCRSIFPRFLMSSNWPVEINLTVKYGDKM